MPPSDPNDQNNLSLLGSAPSFAAVMEQVSRAAPLDRPVLVIGERGTGKELVAARLHYLSKRWDRPFVKMNCATLATCGARVCGKPKKHSKRACKTR